MSDERAIAVAFLSRPRGATHPVEHPVRKGVEAHGLPARLQIAG